MLIFRPFSDMSRSRHVTSGFASKIYFLRDLNEKFILSDGIFVAICIFVTFSTSGYFSIIIIAIHKKTLLITFFET